MRRRILVLPVAAVAIAAACVYRVTRPETPAAAQRPAAAVARRSPPVLELDDQHKPSRLVRLSGYQGRHPVVVVFYDGEAGADRDVALMRLLRSAERVQSQDLIVLGVSSAVPQINRAAIKRLVEAGVLPDADAYPFLLLSDVSEYDPALYLAAHRAWGRYDAAAQQTLPGVFFIARDGSTAWDEETNLPRPLANPQAFLGDLLGEAAR